MRSIQRNVALRFAVSTALGAAPAVALWRMVPVAGLMALAVLLTLVGFLALTVAPDAIALQRGHTWRWWWRSSDDEGPFWPGTRIPRGGHRIRDLGPPHRDPGSRNA